jgi:acetyl-CoA carboxylase carboxyltransferase component
VTSDQEAVAASLRFLSYLPNNASEKVSIHKSRPPTTRTSAELRGLSLVKSLSDAETFLQLSDGASSNAVAGVARLGGHAVGIVAGPVISGLDIRLTQRVADICSAFDLPLVWVTYGSSLAHPHGLPRVTVVIDADHESQVDTSDLNIALRLGWAANAEKRVDRVIDPAETHSELSAALDWLVANAPASPTSASNETAVDRVVMGDG